EAAVLLDRDIKRLLSANRSALFPWLIRRKDLLDGGIFLQAHLPLFEGSRFDGALIAVLRLDEDVHTVLLDRPLSGYSFSLTEGEEVIWEKVESTRHLRLAHTEEVDLSGVVLNLSVWPNPDQLGAERTFLPEGLLFFILLFAGGTSRLLWTVGEL